MKTFRHFLLVSIIIALTVFTTPTLAAPNQQSKAVVTASAIVVPAQASRMSFLISAPVKEVDVSEGDPVKAGQALIVLNTPDLEYSVIAAQAALRSAQTEANLQRYAHKVWNGNRFISLSGPPELRQIADDKVEQAQAALNIAQAMLMQNTLTAPYDGVIAQINVTPGQFVQATQTALTIGTLDRFQIETTDLSERDIPHVTVGEQASVHIESLNQDFNGKVTAIAPKADTVGGDVVYKVIIELDSQPGGLRWGMSAVVNIGP